LGERLGLRHSTENKEVQPARFQEAISH
jgi:hypothetical protein